MANKKYSPLIRHKNCPVVVRETTQGPHVAEYWCNKHKKHIAWLSKADYAKYKEMINE